jgi:serine protease inhibitor
MPQAAQETTPRTAPRHARAGWRAHARRGAGTVLLVIGVAALGSVACESPLAPRPPALLEALPRALSVHEQQIVQASNTFAFDILRETLRDQPAANVFLSPLSASFALGMTLNGARGATLAGMRGALGFGELGPDEINASYRELIALLLGLDRAVDMRIANSIWAASGFPFHDSFMQAARTYFDAEVTTLDFHASNAALTINQWVDRSTNGRIREIVDDPIPADMVMYLINAIYFKGNWREQFDRNRTQNASFTLDDGAQKTVAMMNRSGGARVHFDLHGTGVTVLELLYGRGAFAMTIVLPSQGQPLDDVLATATAQQWADWTQALSEMVVSVSLPRFRLEYETTMNEPLSALGMANAFCRGCADFTGMSPDGRRLFISEVKQKTYLDVNEQGTEAAAVTSVGVGVVSAPPMIVVNRPFLLAIRERFSGTILFLGRIGDPQSS